MWPHEGLNAHLRHLCCQLGILLHAGCSTGVVLLDKPQPGAQARPTAEVLDHGCSRHRQTACAAWAVAAARQLMLCLHASALTFREYFILRQDCWQLKSRAAIFLYALHQHNNGDRLKEVTAADHSTSCRYMHCKKHPTTGVSGQALPLKAAQRKKARLAAVLT